MKAHIIFKNDTPLGAVLVNAELAHRIQLKLERLANVRTKPHFYHTHTIDILDEKALDQEEDLL